MPEQNKKTIQEEIEKLKASIADLGYAVEETQEGELRVSEKEN